MGEHSLLLQDGGEHQRARKLLMPAFNGHALQELPGPGHRGRPGRGRALARPAQTFQALDRMNALTLEVILARRLRRHRRDAGSRALRPRVNATVDVSPAVLLGWGFPALRRFGPWKRTVENQLRARRS